RAAASGLHRILLRTSGLGRLGLLDNRASGAGTRADLAVNEVANFLKDYLTEPLPLGILAQRYSITRDYLSKCFRKRFGLSLSQYRLKCRMEEALYYIQKSTLSFSAIAAQVGFHDPHHFNKRVRKYFKKNPSELRGENG
ncbi:MAG: helix-turn-helix transcriptional regulator, partial [Spirochaetia bacterium]|nr:helix-turn-helix transcriptional regulator [Spirochaetia bacterium]